MAIIPNLYYTLLTNTIKNSDPNAVIISGKTVLVYKFVVT